MALSGAIEIGRSGLVAAQAGIQVAGNNLANAATPGYSRQSLRLSPTADQLAGQFAFGRGVSIRAIERQVDEALVERLRRGVSTEASANERSGVLAQLESVLGELSGFDLSSELSSFFNVWSDAANLNQSGVAVVEQGRALADFVRTLRSELFDLRDQIEAQITERVSRGDAVLAEVAALNEQIASAESPGLSANALRDRRDELLRELSGLIDITVQETASGMVDVFVGSKPVLIANQNFGLAVRREVDGQTSTAVVVSGEPQTELTISGGSIGGLLESRGASIEDTLDRLDTLASALIFEVNRVHSVGSNVGGLASATGTVAVPPSDRTLAFNDPSNQTFAGLPFGAVNGTLIVNVVNAATGTSDQQPIEIDLDGLNGDDTTPQDLVNALNAVSGISASFDSQGRVSVTADAGFSFSFQDDTSGVLATLGVNSYFEGEDSRNIAVRQGLIDDPDSVALGRLVDGVFVENQTALDIAGLQDRASASLGGGTPRGFWSEAVQSVANAAATAAVEGESARLVRESLEAQRDAISGVSIDEESLDLMNFQRQFQASARVLSTADELLNTLMAIV